MLVNNNFELHLEFKVKSVKDLHEEKLNLQNQVRLMSNATFVIQSYMMTQAQMLDKDLGFKRVKAGARTDVYMTAVNYRRHAFWEGKFFSI